MLPQLDDSSRQSVIRMNHVVSRYLFEQLIICLRPAPA